jgi:acetolactate synthase-1/2/3 large subunit
MSSRTLTPDTTAEAYLELLKDRGVDVFLGNAGPDFASLVEAFARFEAEGRSAPRPLLVPHEFVAVSMAHGYYVAGGKPAAVMVHVNVGTANCLNNLINAARDNVPIVLLAGRTPVTERGRKGSRTRPIHWAQEMFDQAGMLREIVKWDYELRYPEQAADAVRRAVEIALTPPRGPVYLVLPREALAGDAPAAGGRRCST